MICNRRLSVVAPFLLGAVVASAQWNLPDTTRFTDTNVPLKPATQSLVLDREGWQHALWLQYDFATSGYDVLYSTNRPDSVWTEPEEVNAPVEACFEAELGFDPVNDRPVVVYQTFDDLLLASRIDGEWSRDTIFTGDASFTYTPSMAVDSNGVVHVCWVNFVETGVYSLAYRAVQEGSPVRILEEANLGEFGGGAIPRLSVSPEGAAFIAYANGGVGLRRVILASNTSFDNPEWSYQDVSSPSLQSSFPSIVVTSQEHIHLAMIGNNGFDQPVSVWYKADLLDGWNPAERVTQEVDTLNWGYPVLRLDQTERPHVISTSVIGSVPSGLLAYSGRRSDASWHSEVIESDDWSYPGFVIDNNLFGHALVFRGYNDQTGDFDFWHVTSANPLVLVPEIAVDPDVLDFGEVLVGDDALQSLTIRNVGASDLTVSSILSPANFATDFTTPELLPPNGETVVTVVFSPTAEAEYVGELQIVSDAPQSPFLVPVLGLGTVPDLPQLSVSPASLEFGEVSVTQSSSLPLLLRNVGTADLILMTLAPSVPYSTDFVGPMTLDPQSEVTVSVTFAPIQVQEYVGTLQIVSNAPDPVHSVPLHGVGTSPSALEEPASLPVGHALLEAYPNPFNQSTTIEFFIPTAGPVTLEVFDVAGRRLEVLRNGMEGEGYHTVRWQADEIGSGLFFCRLTAGERVLTRKMMLLK